MSRLDELCELYDLTAEQFDGVYADEIAAAELALLEKAYEEYQNLLFWQNQRTNWQQVTEETLKECEGQIKELVIKLGKTFKSRLHTWVYGNGRESWNNDMVKGFLIAHNADPAMFMQVKEPNVSKRRNKVNKEL